MRPRSPAPPTRLRAGSGQVAHWLPRRVSHYRCGSSAADRSASLRACYRIQLTLLVPVRIVSRLRCMLTSAFGVGRWTLGVERWTFAASHPTRSTSVRCKTAKLLRSRLIFFVTDFLHPVDRLAVQRFLNGDVSHRG